MGSLLSTLWLRLKHEEPFEEYDDESLARIWALEDVNKMLAIELRELEEFLEKDWAEIRLLREELKAKIMALESARGK